jgi:hypothetical protein
MDRPRPRRPTDQRLTTSLRRPTCPNPHISSLPSLLSPPVQPAFGTLSPVRSRLRAVGCLRLASAPTDLLPIPQPTLTPRALRPTLPTSLTRASTICLPSLFTLRYCMSHDSHLRASALPCSRPSVPCGIPCQPTFDDCPCRPSTTARADLRSAARCNVSHAIPLQCLSTLLCCQPPTTTAPRPIDRLTLDDRHP